jgi:replicative DNA helicase
MLPTLTEPSAIQARLAQLEQENAYEHYRPLRDAADEFINWAVDPASRVYTGIPELDDAMRGTAPGELTLIQGFTHSGKTLVATELLLNNPDTPLVLFTPDETRPLVLTKLTSALHGVSARELETRIQQDDYEARQLLIETAEQYGKLAIFDESVSVVDMDNMFDEAANALGVKPKGVIFDYAESFGTGFTVAHCTALDDGAGNGTVTVSGTASCRFTILYD